MHSIFRAAVLAAIAIAMVACDHQAPRARAMDATLGNETRIHRFDPDQVLQDKVRRALGVSDPISAYGVEVAVTDRRVTLYGTVEKTAERKRFEVLTAGVVGVKGVRNRIVVHSGA